MTAAHRLSYFRVSLNGWSCGRWMASEKQVLLLVVVAWLPTALSPARRLCTTVWNTASVAAIIHSTADIMYHIHSCWLNDLSTLPTPLCNKNLGTKIKLNVGACEIVSCCLTWRRQHLLTIQSNPIRFILITYALKNWRLVSLIYLILTCPKQKIK